MRGKSSLGASLRRAALHVCAFALVGTASGCYVGTQRTSSVGLTEPIDESDNMPSSDLSFAAHQYELTGGFIFSGFELFTGFGMDFAPRVHQRTTNSVMRSDTLPITRVHLGAAYEVWNLEGFGVRLFGIIAGEGTALLFDDLAEGDPEITESIITSSKELGVQISSISRFSTEKHYFEPVARIGYAWQSGRAHGDGYTSPEGTTSFSARALVVTMGFNFGYLGGQKW